MVGDLDDHPLIKFGHTSSERTFAGFIDHHARSKDYYLCSPQKTIEKNPVHQFAWDDKFMPSDEKEREGVVLVFEVFYPRKTCTKAQNTKVWQRGDAFRQKTTTHHI